MVLGENEILKRKFDFLGYNDIPMEKNIGFLHKISHKFILIATIYYQQPNEPLESSCIKIQVVSQRIMSILPIQGHENL